jgi:acetyl-CoA/propionyl-CoA carboxylase biotin carboxyl carrier protein
VLPSGFGATATDSAQAKKAKKRGRKKHGGAAAGGDALTSPMQGTVVKVTAEEGASVEAGDPVIVIEAMKMEQPINAHKAGTVTGLSAEVGATLTNGAVICEIKD